MEKAAEAIVRKKIKDTQIWIGKNEWFAQSNIQRVDEGLTVRGPAGIAGVSVGLDMLATYYGNCGISMEIAGDRAAWNVVDRSMMCRFWSKRIDFVRHFKSRPEEAHDLTILLSTSACLVCYFLATDRMEYGSILANLLLKTIWSPGHVSAQYWKDRIFEPFVLRLYKKLGDISLPEYLLSRDLGPYAKIFEHWEGGEGLAAALVDLCNYHCRNMNDNGARAWDPEFKRSPFGLIPVEIRRNLSGSR